jgi:activating signal cointegrator 1
MKAITICQPYAHLIVSGAKRVENRTWPTSYRGLIYIHAGKSRLWLDLDDTESLIDSSYNIPIADMAFGAVVAVAKLVDCVKFVDIEVGNYNKKYPWLYDHQHASGPWCWILDSVSPVGPWPYRGAQGLFEIKDDELDAVANRAIGVSA